MVGPARRREAVAHVCDSLKASQRRACKVLDQARSTQRYKRKIREQEERLRKEMRKKAVANPRYGYRRVAALLRGEGWKVNNKRVHRLWKQEGFRVKKNTIKKRRVGKEENGSQRMQATRINEVWSYDFVFDQTEDGGRLKWLPIVDEYSRENLALEVERNISSNQIIEVLDWVVVERGGPPKYMRSDNGPEFIARAVQEWIKTRGFDTLYIEPGSPWQNAYIESFNARLRDELLNVECFGSLLEAKVLAKEYRHRYNHLRPHSALGYQTPAQFAASNFSSLRVTPFATQNG